MKKRRERRKKITRHHIKNRVNGGISQPENLLRLTQEHHNLLHVLFKNLDFYDIILLLIRICKLKHYERINPKIREFYYFTSSKKLILKQSI